MLPRFCKDTVTVLRAPLVSSRGSKVRDWANAVQSTVSGCSVQPYSADGDGLDMSDRENARLTMILYAPPGADIKKGDRVRFGGRDFYVDGIPVSWRSATGRLSHTYCRLQDWEG